MGACGSAQADQTKPVTVAEPKKEAAAPATEQKVVAAKSSDPEDKYETIKLLGEGASCKVACVKDKTSGKLFAMKIITHRPEFQTMYEVEVHILAQLKHPNVVEMHEHFEDKAKKSWRILTGMCRGGELFDRVKNGSFSEKAAARLTREMVAAVHYCHGVNIVHRDIKPENFVMDTPAADSHMKLIDFGCAKEVKDDELVKDFAGSPYYVAPEVLTDYKRTGLTWKAADMWSIGVIIYLLVTGYPPFNGRTQDEIFDAIRQQPVRWPRASEIPLSKSVKDLISKLLVKDPTKRLTAEQALRHPWIGGEEAPETPLPESVTRSLGNFQNQCKLKKVVGKVIANRLTDDDKASLAAVFKQFDKNGDGQLGPEEIAAMMKHIGGQDSDWKEFVAKFDEDGSGAISQDEFAAATVAGKLSDQTAEELKRNFDIFDQDKDGFVTAKEIEQICGGMDPSAAKALIGEVDKNSDGKVNFLEWLEAMKGSQETKKKAAAAAGHTS